MSIKTIGELYRVDGELLSRQYKQHISGFEDWELREKAEEYVLFPNNIGSHLSIDETCLSHDELYTIVIQGQERLFGCNDKRNKSRCCY